MYDKTDIIERKAKMLMNSWYISSLPVSQNAKYRLAFTLAEVLITLAIIGIVAALTIPTLVNNYQKTQYVTQLKKAYTSVNQALMKLTSDYDCPGDLECS
jgi:prepilin-type N-terminal cleavage/methylation domain-containing protein